MLSASIATIDTPQSEALTVILVLTISSISGTDAGISLATYTLGLWGSCHLHVTVLTKISACSWDIYVQSDFHIVLVSYLMKLHYHGIEFK